MQADPTEVLIRLGLRAGHLRSLSFAAVGLCTALWIRAKTVSQEERGNAERRAIFVGHWPPTLYLIAESLERHTAPPPLAGALRGRSVRHRRRRAPFVR